MKKVLTFLLALMLSVTTLQLSAQMLGDYAFSTGTDATKWIPLSTTTSLIAAGAGDYGVSTVEDIGFTFNFAGTPYTQFSVNADGNLKFDSVVTGTNSYSIPFSASYANANNPKINAFGCDGYLNTTGYVYHEVVGTAPNRICVIEFSTSTYTSDTRTTDYIWQVQLFEGTNDIQIVYPSTTPALAPAVARQPGMCVDASDIVLINSNHTVTCLDAGSATNNVPISTWPDADRYYMFSIPTDLCIRPGNLAISEILQEEALFTWSAGGSESSWDVYITDQTAAPDENTVPTASVTDTFYNIYNLTAATKYYVYVRANCGGSYSGWRSVNFMTACPDYAAIPYEETFDNYGTGTASTSFPQCWNRLTNYTTQYPYISSSSAYSAPGNLYFYSTSSYYSMAIAPEIDTVNYPINTLTVNFLIRKTSSTTSYGAIQIGVMTDPTDASTFTPVATYTGSELTQTNQWYEIEVALSNYTGYGSYIALRKPMDASTGTYTYIDNFRIYPSPTCLKPVNVAVSNVTDNSAELAWVSRSNESEWQVVVVPHGEEISTGTPENVYDMPYTLTNLTDNTQYDVYVKAICGGGDESEWSNMKTFTTRCLPTNVIPFEEDFSTYGTGSTAFPNCWTRHREGTTTEYPYVSTSYGAGSLYFYSSSTVYSYAASQALDLTGENPGSLVFSWDAYSSTTSYGRIDVGYMTDPDDISTFVRLKSIYSNNLQPVSNWYNFSVVLPEDAYQHQNIYLAFYAPSRESNYVYIDNVKVDYTPTCSNPTNLTVTNVAGSSALVSWTEGQFGTPDYNVEYSEAGQDNWTSVTVSGETSVMLTGLSELTAYDVRVSVDCPDVTEPSYITNSFVTLCNAGGAVNFEGGTATSYYVPLNNYFNYTYTQQIFLASEMGGATTINSVAFDYAYATASSSKSNVDIYLKHTNKSSFSSTTDYEPITGAQLVYSGNLNCQQGWNTFTFTTPFQYNGVDNLMLIVDDNSGSYNGSSYVFHVEAQSASRSLYYYSDSANPDPSDPTAAGANSAVNANRSNVRFGGNCDSLATCIAPNVYVTNVDDENITIDWVAGAGESAWELEYKLDSESTWTSEGIVTTAPYTITGLTSNAAYTIRMRSDCGGEYSSWKGVSANTTCSDVNVPFMENFEGTTAATGAMVPCWTRKTNYSTAYPYLSTTQHVSGSNAVYFYGSTTAYSYIASPRFAEDVIMDSLQIQFQAYRTSSNYMIEVGIMTDPNDVNTFDVIGSFSPSAQSTWELAEFRTSGYMGNGRYVALRIPQWFSSNMYVDDINIDYIPNCLHVDNVHVVGSTIETDAADITWTPGGDESEWEVVYGEAGTITDLNNESTVTVYENTISLTDLTPNTQYEVFVKANCSNGEGSGWMSTTFRTACTAIDQLPYVENFDNYGTGESAYPNCWEKINTYSSNRPYITTTNYSAPGSMYFYAGTSGTYNIAIMPLFDASIDVNTLQATFMYKASNSTDRLIVGVMTDPTDAATFVPVSTIAPESTASTWAERTVDFTSYTGTGRYIAFKNAYTTTSSYAYLDNLVIDHAPSCDAPTNFTLTNVSATEAEFTWADAASESSWQVYVFPTGGDQDMDQAVTVYNNTYTLSGLTANTAYTAMLRTECSNGEGYSNWVVLSFRTACTAIDQLPYVENFDNYGTGESAYPNCWSKLNTYSSDRPYINTTNYSAPGSMYFYAGTAGTYNVAITPVFAESIQVNTLQAKFRYKATNASDRLIVGVMSNPNDINTFVAVETVAPDATVSQWVERTVEFTNYNGTGKYIAFKNEYTTTTAYGYLDNLEIDLAPECSTPSLEVLSLGTSSAEIGWDDDMSTSWQFYVCAANETPDYSQAETVTSTNYMLSDLAGNTMYNVYVRAICPTSGYSNWAHVSFATLAGEPAQTPYFTDWSDSDENAEWTLVNGTETNKWYVGIPTGETDSVLFVSENGTANTYANTASAVWAYRDIQFGDGAEFTLNVKWKGHGESSYDYLKVFIGTPATVVPGEYGDPAGATQLGGGVLNLQDNWQYLSETLNGSYANSIKRLYLLWRNDVSVNNPPAISIDTIEILASDCGRPYSVTASTVDAYSADVTFSAASASDNAWEYVLVQGSTSPDDPSVVPVGIYNTTFTLDMLTPVTTYKVYVRTDCGSGSYSEWSVAAQFTTLESCPTPSQVTVSNIGLSSADIAWTENGSATTWNIEYGPAGFTAGQGITEVVTTNPYTLTGLNASTSYDVRVQADCGGEVSSWSSVKTFATECGFVTLPYTENFDYVAGSTTTSVSINNLPACWNHLAGTYSSYAGYPIVYNSSTYAASGSNAMRFYTGTTTTYDYGNQYGILPAIDVNANPMNTLTVSFDARKNSTSYPIFTLIVGVMSDATAASSFVPVDTIEIDATTYATYEVNFTNYTGTGNRIAFMAPWNTSSSYNTGYVDNIVVDLTPSCLKPTSLTTTSATTSSIVLGWTENGSATTWNIEYGPVGFTAGQGTLVVANTNPFTLTGLNASTSYDVRVQADCGGGDVSTWSAVKTFATECDLMTLPYVENFDTYTGTAYNTDGTAPTCWFTSTTSTSYPAPHITGSGSYSYPNSAPNALTFTGSNPGSDAYAVLPEFTDALNTIELAFAYRVESILYGTLTVGYVTDANNPGTTFNTVATMNSTTTITLDTVSFANVPATATGRLAFHWNYVGTSFYSCGIDDISVYVAGTAPATCDAPTNVAASNVTATGATITWTAGGSETAWNLQYKTAASSSWSNSIAVNGTPSYTLSNLTAATAYSVRVQANCGDATSTWAEGTFTTANGAGTSCDAPTNLSASNATTNSVILNWSQADASVHSWTINYKKSSDNTWTSVTANTHPYTLTGLEYNTVYDVKVAANCDGTTSDYTAVVNFRTAGDGVEDYVLTNSINLYPNPATTTVTIQSANGMMKSVEVYDVYGKMLNMVEVNDAQVTMNIANYAAGTYFVRVNTENGMVTKRIVKR
ncbi:MAG: fibronectin type III domain-containing protein [Bacteroidales bacterium]|nr:fibronectin type III domain-containing protein [Bacteroidales bacterium]